MTSLPTSVETRIERAEGLAADLLRRSVEKRSVLERLRAARVAKLIEDPEGFALVLSLTDEVLRIRDPSRAARLLSNLASGAGAGSFSAFDRLALRAGGRIGQRMPKLVMPLVRERVRAEFAGVVIPAESRPLRRHLARRAGQGIRLNLNVLGEAVLGEGEAERRLVTVMDLLRRPDVDYVSVKISAVCSQLNVLDFDEEVRRISGRLRRLYDVALSSRPAKFVNLDMEEYRDLELTLAAFKAVLDESRYRGLDAGVVLQAYIPDSLPALLDLCAWAKQRRASGGGRIKVRVVKGANLAMEQVEAELQGWRQAPYTSKADADANFKRMLEVVLDPEYADSVRVGVASHNLFEIAWALVRREECQASERVEIEMLEGMANATALAVKETAGDLLLYAPIVKRSDTESAIAYLVRRLDENTGPENFLAQQFSLSVGSPAWRSELERFETAVADSATRTVDTRRTQDRFVEEAEPSAATPRDRASDAVLTEAGFWNEPDTDFSVAANRSWVEHHLGSWRDDHETPVPVVVDGTRHDDGDLLEGVDPGVSNGSEGRTVYRWAHADTTLVDQAVATACKAQISWRELSWSARREQLGAVADALASRRGRLIACMSYDAGKAVSEGDPEVSEAIDFARWYAATTESVQRLESEGLDFEAHGPVVVASPWNFPVSIPAGGVLAALAAGSSVILKPAPETVAVGWELAQAIWNAGVPEDVLQFVPCADDEAGRRLVTHPDVGTVILTGAWSTARMFLDWRPELRLHAETSGKNAIVVTATADLDAAVADLVRSAFGNAGQKCSAASLGILEASVYDDKAFRRQLADAVRSLRPGPGWNLTTTIGPLIRPPEPPLKKALSHLSGEELWLVEPEQVGSNAQLYRPGVKLGVAPGSEFHMTECFGPVLGLMRADDLAQSVEWQNQTPYGLTAGLHALDPDEIRYWTERVEAGNLYVNRHITGAIVRRQPFGGWKRSTFGPGAKAGGPNYVLSLGSFTERAEDRVRPEPGGRAENGGRAEDGRRPSTATWRADPGGFSRRCAELWSDMSRGWDPSGLSAEANVFRYRPLPRVIVRAGPGVPAADLDLARRAAQAAGAEVFLSVSEPVALEGLPVAVEDERSFVSGLEGKHFDKVRLLGELSDRTRLALVDLGLWLDETPVVAHPEVEMLRWSREQAISESLHRYGNVTGRRRGPLQGENL